MNRDAAPKPIETEYAGCRFRSRLEARWAVAFDAIGERWLYEPQGFTVKMPTGQSVPYLPDFYLPARKVWIEVKGSNDALVTEWMTLMLACTPQFGIPLDPEGTAVPVAADLHRMMILGPVPQRRGNIANRRGFLLLGLTAGELVIRHCDLLGNYTAPVFDVRNHEEFPAQVGNCLHLEGHTVDVAWSDEQACALESARVDYALTCARAARFEHGEKPKFPVWRKGEQPPEVAA